MVERSWLGLRWERGVRDGRELTQYVFGIVNRPVLHPHAAPTEAMTPFSFLYSVGARRFNT